MQEKTETTITGESELCLPAETLRELGWHCGDSVTVSVLGPDTVVLTRQPIDWVKRFSGKMGDIWGDHEDNMRYLDEERASWEESVLAKIRDDDR